MKVDSEGRSGVLTFVDASQYTLYSIQYTVFSSSMNTFFGRLSKALFVVCLTLLLPVTVSASRGRMDAHYARDTLQYDPSGAVLQVSYAQEAVRVKGGPIIGLCTDHGICLAVISVQEDAGKHSFSHGKKLGSAKVSLLEDDEVILCVTGLNSDAAFLIETAKTLCRNYRTTYDCAIPPEALASSLADILHTQTRQRGTRPLAVAAIVAGFDQSSRRPSMFAVDTEGSCTSHHACFLGGNGAALDNFARDVEKEFSGDRGGKDMGMDTARAFLEGCIRTNFRGKEGNADDVDDSPVSPCVRVFLGRVADGGDGGRKMHWSKHEPDSEYSSE